MRIHDRATIPIVLMLAASAGCLGGEGSGAFHAFASKGSIAAGFAYDGKGVQPFGGDAAIDVNEKSNTGLLVAKGMVGGAEFVVTFDRFSEAPGKPFQNGGLAADFREHGASGVGDRSIPEVDLAMAGWGKARMTRGGQPLIDPFTGLPDWAAHFMVIRNGVRNDTTGGIYQDENNAKVYDNATGIGHSVPGDWELHLVLRNGVPSKPVQPASIQQNDGFEAASATSYSKTKDFFISGAVGARADFNITVTGAADLTFRFLDPAGRQVGSPVQINTLNTNSPGGTITRPASFVTEALGDYKVKVEGKMASPNAGWALRGTLSPPPEIVLYLWWEDLLLGEDAEKKMDQTGLIRHGNHGAGNTTKAA